MLGTAIGTIEILFAAIVLAFVSLIGADVLYRNVKLNKVNGGQMLVLYGSMMVLLAVTLLLQLQLRIVTSNGVDTIGLTIQDMIKLVTSLSLGTIGTSIVTGGFSMIGGSKHGFEVCSSEQIEFTAGLSRDPQNSGDNKDSGSEDKDEDSK